MVDEYLSDREQEEALLNWWRQNWRWVISGVVLGLALLLGWQQWQQHQRTQGENAAKSLTDLGEAVAAKNSGKIDQLVKSLDQEHSGSVYADQAHLLLAQEKVASGQFEQAASELKLVVDRTKDADLGQVARTRLARVHLQLGHPDEVLKLLDVSKAGSFAAAFNEIRGDALLAKGDRAGAKLAYQSALSGSGADAQDLAPEAAELLRLKIQDLADAAAAAPAADAPIPAPVAPK